MISVKMACLLGEKCAVMSVIRWEILHTGFRYLVWKLDFVRVGHIMQLWQRMIFSSASHAWWFGEILLGGVFFLLKMFYSYSESVRYRFICKQLKCSICNTPHKSIITVKMTRQHHRNWLLELIEVTIRLWNCFVLIAYSWFLSIIWHSDCVSCSKQMFWHD